MWYSHFPCRHLSQSTTLLGNYTLNNGRRGLILKGEPLGRYDHSIIDILEENIMANTFLSWFYFYLTKHVCGISLDHCWSLRRLIDWYMTWCLRENSYHYPYKYIHVLFWKFCYRSSLKLVDGNMWKLLDKPTLWIIVNWSTFLRSVSLLKKQKCELFIL